MITSELAMFHLSGQRSSMTFSSLQHTSLYLVNLYSICLEFLTQTVQSHPNTLSPAEYEGIKCWPGIENNNNIDKKLWYW